MNAKWWSLLFPCMILTSGASVLLLAHCSAHVPPSPREHFPALLDRVLTIIPFHWHVGKTVHLHLVLVNTLMYPTHVDILIVTDNKRAVDVLLSDWGMKDRLEVVEVEKHDPTPNVPSQFGLLWNTRGILQKAFYGGTHTAFLYIEDDTYVRWPLVCSWAMDSLILEPLNLTRGIFRTELHAELGHRVMMDEWRTLNLSQWDLKVDATVASPSRFRTVSNTYKGTTCTDPMLKRAWLCEPHRRFVQLPQPFQGMWIATRKTLESWLQHPFWDKAMSLEAHNHTELFRSKASYDLVESWGYPERSNAMPLVMNVPEGFHTTNVVPYILSPDGRGAHLSELALVEHLRNGYSTIPHVAQRMRAWKTIMAV
jgi:hypothetical protein